MTMAISTEMGVTAPLTASPTTKPKMRIFVRPLTAGIPVSTSIPMSPHPQVRARLDDEFITMQNLSREQPYGMPTSMMANFHNIVSTFEDHTNSFTSYNTHSPSSSSIFDRNVPPTLTIESMISLRQQMDESNYVMVNMHVNTMNWYSF
jgi:hypothetical protein